MFKVGKQVETALLALQELDASTSGTSISSICEKHKLSKNTLSKVLQILLNSGHLRSAQGVKGGYSLKRPLSEISFFELLTELNEVKRLTCHFNDECELQDTCTIKSPLKEWESKFENFLKSTPVSDLVSQQKPLSNKGLNL